MHLFLQRYIERYLRKAEYEYDPETQSWLGSINQLPGVYAQADSVEELRTKLVEVIEDYVYVSLHEGHLLPNFKRLSKMSYAKADQ